MTRGVSAAAKVYTGPLHWTVDITDVAGTVHYFWTGFASKTIDGHPYLPYLRIPSGFRHTKALQVDAGEIDLLNVDLYIDGLIAVAKFDGGLFIVQQYLTAIEERVEIMRGRFADEQRGPEVVSYRAVSGLEPGEIDVLPIEYSALCRWRFAKNRCGYLNASIAVTENLAERTADDVQTHNITDSTLSMTTGEHIDRIVLVTAGTGKGQARRIKNNSAGTIAIYQEWADPAPVAGSKFRVITAANGGPKQLFTATSALDKATADIHTARTIGLSTLAMTTDEHKSTATDAISAVVAIVAGTGSGQERNIKGNTATTITIADDAADFSPVPDGTSQFRVLYRTCPKDVAQACEQRGRTHRFNGTPTMSPNLTRIYGQQSGGNPDSPPDTPQTPPIDLMDLGG